MLNENNIPSIEDVREKVEEYGTTIMALRAFCQIITDFHTDNGPSAVSRISYGRKMNTSSKNRVHPNNSATPDAVIQVGDRWGMVVEAKRTMPKNIDDRWRATVDQMMKYDDTLQGWWTANGVLNPTNVVLLVDVDRSIDFSRYIQSLIDSNEIPPFQCPTAIVEFFKKQEVKQFLRVRQVWGKTEPSSLAQKLESGKSIAAEGLIDGQRFYDQEPGAVEYTMVLLWQVVFTERYFSSKFDEISKSWFIEVDLDELTVDLQNLYGNKSNEARERTFPRKKWIQKALEAFVLLNLAFRSDDKNKYVVKFKKLRGGDLFQRFYKHREVTKKKINKDNLGQLELFEASTSANNTEPESVPSQDDE